MAKRIVSVIVLLLMVNVLFAQSDPLAQARAFSEKKEYDKAAEAYKKMYEQNPADNDVYTEYLELLLQTKNYKEAEKIVDIQKQGKPNWPMPFVDAGRVLQAAGKDKKATEQYDEAIARLNGDDNWTRQVANKFVAMGNDDYAIKAYERVREQFQVKYMYTGPLSRLYAKKGETEKAIAVMLDGGQAFMMNGAEDTKAGLLEVLGNDPKKLQAGQKALIKKINEQPDNPFFTDLLTWLYTQKDDWDGALMQVVALDTRLKEQGGRMLGFARYAVKEEKYDIAVKAYDEIVSLGNDIPYYTIAASERLTAQFAALQKNVNFTQQDVDALLKQYDAFFTVSPQFYANDLVCDYAKLQAQFNNNPKAGIAILKKALEQPGLTKMLNGQCKLQLGDYMILDGDVWESSLLYSQVDKAFREDVLGEEARFRNAKLAYYRGDFDWAQGQLTVLKASTAELIANDALYLSILITENITEDSNVTPLKRFAYADLLLFQNKDKEADALLDSIVTNYPQHPLYDDILLQKAKLAQKHREYEKAIEYLVTIHAKHGKDVLGDDAVFRMADIYERYMNKPEDAKKYYEMLIMEYGGSTFVQIARNRLTALQAGVAVP
ncbi:MAG: tetratricopeptide repeat protein [Chitinophagales bacterium]|nr:tetratricopeptide repeat protein [Chitinophagales bacterium]